MKCNYKVVAIDIDEKSIAYLLGSVKLPPSGGGSSHRVRGIPEEYIYIEDIRNFMKIKFIVDHHNADVVVNCVALKHVMWCDLNMRHAIEVSVLADLELINYLRKKKKKVKTRRMDTLGVLPNFIKMDLEGHEVEVVKGGMECLKETSKCKILL